MLKKDENRRLFIVIQSIAVPSDTIQMSAANRQVQRGFAQGSALRPGDIVASRWRHVTSYLHHMTKTY